MKNKNSVWKSDASVVFSAKNLGFFEPDGIFFEDEDGFFIGSRTSRAKAMPLKSE
jgi:hypothetical protein